jgi:hypothetical protein
MAELVLIAAAPSRSRDAAEAQAQIKALGYAAEVVDPGARGVGKRVRSARRVVFLWSPDAARSPGLRVLARRARAAGKLSTIRLEGAPSPHRVRGSRTSAWPRVRGGANGWRNFVEAADMQAVVGERRVSSGRWGAFLMVLLFGLVTATAFYATNPAFAARVDSVITSARAMVGQAG